MNPLPLILINISTLLACIIALWLLSIKIKDVSIIDMFFGIAIGIMAVISFYLGAGNEQRKLIMLALTLLWVLRYSTHIFARNWGHGEDVRYAKLRNWVAKPEDFKWLSLKLVFLYQWLIFVLMGLPICVGMSQGSNIELGILGAIGACITLLGIIFEGTADYQLKQFKANSANKGKILNTGIWRYSRHPNYFGNSCVWWGLWLISCEVPWGWLTIIGPIAITYFLVKVTGKATLEKKMLKEKPGYADYVASTSGFVLWFPKKVNKYY